ncbi:MAG: glucose-6-phosphate isomerase [Gammaproteobacteria bacterium]
MTIDQSSAWTALKEHRARTAEIRLRDRFARDPARATKYSLRAADLFLDYSKNFIDAEAMQLLTALGRQAQIEQWRERMFSGDAINLTERRAVLHTALRGIHGEPLRVDGVDVTQAVRATLGRMQQMVHRVRSGEWRGNTGQRITDIVNIGIGGSHLGPLMTVTALRAHHIPGLRVHHCANIDPADLGLALRHLNPETTLFIVVSKTFTTQETMANARMAQSWLQNALPNATRGRHFIAVSSNVSAVEAFGIEPDNILEMWDWVGGRYSMWSAVGLSIAMAVGMDAFSEILDGAARMDRHFRSEPLESNMPVILALVGIWYGNFCHAETHCVVPYEESLCHLPAYLQQLDMESNGKRCNRDGVDAHCSTGPIVWGGTGTNAQHAYFQLLHQGGRLIPVDFLVGLQPVAGDPSQHRMLFANCLAQAAALMQGRTLEETRAQLQTVGLTGAEIEALAPHCVFPGNQPSNMLLYPKLTPNVLGQLIALYEHKVFVQGVIWGLNSFDQWGVQLGKELATNILGELEGGATKQHDSSTANLIAMYRDKTCR